MYRNKFPEVGDLISAKISKVDESIIMCQLLEYNNIEAILPLNQVSRKRIRSIKNIIKIGKDEILEVINVDPDRNHITLSKRDVNPEQIEIQNNYFNSSKIVHNLLKRTAETGDMELKDLYQNFGWILYDKYDHAIDGLLEISSNICLLEDYNLTNTTKDILTKLICHKFKIKNVKIQALVDVNCFEKGGMYAIKNCLIQSKIFIKDSIDKLNCEDIIFNINLYSTPTYLIKITTPENHKNSCQDLIQQTMEFMKNYITSHGGILTIKQDAQIINLNN